MPPRTGAVAGVITSVLPGPGQDGLSPSIGLALVRRQALGCDTLQLEEGRQVTLHNPFGCSTEAAINNGQ